MRGKTIFFINYLPSEDKTTKKIQKDNNIITMLNIYFVRFNFTNIPDYNLFRRDRTGRRGGGVAVYVRCSLNSDICDYQIADVRIELLWIEVTFDSRIYIIGALYHPPKPLYKDAELLFEIENSVAKVTANYSNATVMLCWRLQSLI